MSGYLVTLRGLGELSESERILVEHSLERAIDNLSGMIREYRLEYGGLGGAWEWVSGSPGLQPLRDDAATLRLRIATAPLAESVRERLFKRLVRVEKMILPADMKVLVVGGLLFLAWKGLGAAAGAGAGTLAGKTRTYFAARRRPGERPGRG